MDCSLQLALKALYHPEAQTCPRDGKIPGWGSLLKGRKNQTELLGTILSYLQLRPGQLALVSFQA